MVRTEASLRTLRPFRVVKKLRAYLRLLRTKIVRDRLSPDRVAAGWAIGMFCGCAIPFGLQLMISIPAAIATRTSKIGATLGTFVTNPFTIVFIYPAQTWAVYRGLFGEAPALPAEWTWQSLNGLGWRVLLSYLLGGLLIALVLTPITYFAVRRTVVAARAATLKIKDRMEVRKALDDLP